jgi:Flp pilus assembly pilin Flp
MWLAIEGYTFKLQSMKAWEEGQDLVEYAFVIALIALGVVTSMKPLAVLLSTMFVNLASEFTSFVA